MYVLGQQFQILNQNLVYKLLRLDFVIRVYVYVILIKEIYQQYGYIIVIGNRMETSLTINWLTKTDWQNNFRQSRFG